ncbi:MAG: short-chain dehydrogenase/reductase [Verrucomicrobiaceae bacterium]|nr:short-chain dehydrogenase/reductase [Verrucomicrobiaceae bacterium]
MIRRQSGSILNTASIAGFEPGPRLKAYHSTKAFLLSWSEALAHELSDTPVTVTALCPGPTDTDFFPKADMEDVRGFQQASLMAPQDVAKAGYEGLMERQLFVVSGVMNKALVAARSCSRNQRKPASTPSSTRKCPRTNKHASAATWTCCSELISCPWPQRYRR